MQGFTTSDRVCAVLKARRLWMMDWICYEMKWLCVKVLFQLLPVMTGKLL
jgi:hypothetical protein